MRELERRGRERKRVAVAHLLFFLLLLWVFPLQACAAPKRPVPDPSPPTAKRKIIPSYPSYLNAFRSAAGSVGIEVVALPSGELVWAHHERQPMVPASVVKVLTSYVALKNLGPYHRFDTKVMAASAPQGGVVRGPVWIKGFGDPYFLSEKAWILARKLRTSGVREIRGGVFVDNSYFDPGIEKICIDGHCSSPYNPIISPTSLEFNTVNHQLFPGATAGSAVEIECYPVPPESDAVATLSGEAQKPGERVLLVKYEGGRVREEARGTSVKEASAAEIELPQPVTANYKCGANAPDPAAYVSSAFRNVLEQVGIEVRGPARGEAKAPAGSRVLASYESPPLKDILHGLNRYSNNFMAEMLLRAVGADAVSPPGSLQKGVSVALETLRELGIPPQEVRLDSGSGLSRTCKVSPRTFTRILTHAYRDFSVAPDFIASLATNGCEGTLRKRLRGGEVVVRGKTGTLRNVIAFSGYVSSSGPRCYAVTILLNDVTNRWKARQAIDTFLKDLPNLIGGSV